MNDSMIDTELRAANPFSDAIVSRLRVAGALDALGSEISTTRRAPRRRLVAIGMVAAAIVAIVAVGQPFGGSTQRAYAAPLVRIAEQSPRILVGRNGWQISRADQFSAGDGELTFEGEGRSLDLRWNMAPDGADLTKDRADSSDLHLHVTVLGHPADLFRYADSGGDYTTLWVQGGDVLEARGGFPSLDAYESVLNSLVAVDVNAWLGAMPASVVRPVDRASTVDAMLADMPLPPGFDKAALDAGDEVRDHYQLGAAVSGAVACGWIRSWVDATAAGDSATAAKAVDAMQSSHHWAILLEMKSDGAYPEAVWEYADAMKTGDSIMGGKPLTIAETYADALGCPRAG